MAYYWRGRGGGEGWYDPVDTQPQDEPVFYHNGMFFRTNARMMPDTTSIPMNLPLSEERMGRANQLKARAFYRNEVSNFVMEAVKHYREEANGMGAYTALVGNRSFVHPADPLCMPIREMVCGCLIFCFPEMISEKKGQDNTCSFVVGGIILIAFILLVTEICLGMFTIDMLDMCNEHLVVAGTVSNLTQTCTFADVAACVHSMTSPDSKQPLDIETYLKWRLIFCFFGMCPFMWFSWKRAQRIDEELLEIQKAVYENATGNETVDTSHPPIENTQHEEPAHPQHHYMPATVDRTKGDFQCFQDYTKLSYGQSCCTAIWVFITHFLVGIASAVMDIGMAMEIGVDKCAVLEGKLKQFYSQFYIGQPTMSATVWIMLWTNMFSLIWAISFMLEQCSVACHICRTGSNAIDKMNDYSHGRLQEHKEHMQVRTHGQGGVDEVYDADNVSEHSVEEAVDDRNMPLPSRVPSAASAHPSNTQELEHKKAALQQILKQRYDKVQELKRHEQDSDKGDSRYKATSDRLRSHLSHFNEQIGKLRKEIKQNP